MKWDCVLCRQKPLKIDYYNYQVADLKKIARFWVGKDANKYAKEACIEAIEAVLTNQTAVKNVVAGLSLADQTVLQIYSRFGPSVSGALMSAELHARGLAKPEEEPTPDRYGSYYERRNNDIIATLSDKLLLVSRGGHSFSAYLAQSYPNLTLHPKLWGMIPPAQPVVWKSSAKTPRVQSGGLRSSAEVALELWQVANSLQAMGDWKTLKAGGLSKASQNRLHKLAGFPTVEQHLFVPPDFEGLYYELLRVSGFLDLKSSRVSMPRLEKFLQQPAALQAQQWVRAWMLCELWQDGIGSVSDRNSRYESVRIDSYAYRKAQELLAWALCAVAQSANDWLDLETFLTDLRQATRNDGIGCYWSSFVWNPTFSGSRNKAKLPVGEERSLAYWLDSAGCWAANALWVTLWTLGLIERGHSDDKAARPCFRLTELGHQVFGAPEVEVPDQTTQLPCLMVQPNCEVVAYLDAADAPRICTLARFAERTSAGGQVQTFKLARETVYRGLESGLSAEEIQSFLAEHSKAPVPENVQKTLSQWAGKRESLVLRTGIALLIAPQNSEVPQGLPVREVADSFFLLPRLPPDQVKTHFKSWRTYNHQASLARVWTVNELGEFKSDGGDNISQARLAMLAAPKNTGWQITEASVTKAKAQGLPADQMLDWLAAHLTHNTPPLLETAIRSWTGRASVFLGQVQLLQVTRPQARDAILTSPAFRPLLAGHIPPDWFLVEPSHLADVKRLLKQLGVTITDTYQLHAAEVESPAKPASSKRKGKRRRSPRDY